MRKQCGATVEARGVMQVSPASSREVAEAVFFDAGQRSRLMGYAFSRFGIESDQAEDLLQETALELVRQRTIVHNPGGFVFTVFRSRCCRYLAARREQRDVFSDKPPESGRDPRCDGVESRLALREALGGISAACRKVLLAYYVDGQSLRDAAQETALAHSGVWKTISRCLKRLRRCLN
jgi:RNA polymerase sigma factor (sigma-70 family)